MSPARLRRNRWMTALRGAGLILGLGALSPAAAPAGAQSPAPIEIKVVGGLAGVSQYVRYEAPFWSQRVPGLTGGRVRAEITPFDRAGIRGQEMLQFLRLGVVPFGTVLLALASGDEPEVGAVDLPMLNPDIATLRQTVQLWRPQLESLLHDRYGIRMLAVYAYPAQVMFCDRPFTGLDDLAGRRVRVSSVAQSELMESLRAIPVVTPFAEIVPAIKAGVVECAITGTLSGNAIGLHLVTTHIARAAISWGVSIFGASEAAWAALPEEVRTALKTGLTELETEIWRGAEEETADGLACNVGRPECRGGTSGHMIIVEDQPQEQLRRQEFLTTTVLPAWIQRCGSECAETWNRLVGQARGLRAKAE